MDGIPPGFEGLVDEADKLLHEAASEALSVKVGARTPDELPAPAPAPSAPDEAAMPVAEAMQDEEYESHGMALDRPAVLPPPRGRERDAAT